MQNKYREYSLIEYTLSVCPDCMKTLPAKIVRQDGMIYLIKDYKKHGLQTELIEEDADYFLKRNEFTKPGTKCETQTRIDKGCPFDCGLCEAHEQHTCIGLIEVTSKCDLNCPVCYAKSGDNKILSLNEIEELIDFLIKSENGNAEILQISGGEPTTHKEIIEILRMAKKKNIKYLMLNTNGLRIAIDEDFCKELASIRGNFEIYLQFDGLNDLIYKKIRGKELLDIKLKAIENLSKYKIPITLVATIEKGINEDEIGNIIKFAMENEFIRGINFQPISLTGRLREDHSIKGRITLTGIINRIEKQTEGLVKKEDFIPLPCDVDRIAISYIYRDKKKIIPLTREINIKKYLDVIENTFAFDVDRLKSSNGDSCCGMDFKKELRKFIPTKYYFKPEEEKIDYVNKHFFRISITSFIDAYNFDMKSMQKECVHNITSDKKKIPFSSFNMIHRKKYD